ncbi:outer membrane beta-barrel protein [Rickettsiella endosymbiont of Dermanyssus gallinae]|uniref:outer membrane beta-barrel protein n=1 Tax=Rickettsiella endosymbiont of Dermanyssus gallinae TaxID=2856608 RepID=UPI001C52F209|nr:outer membrane beta-barrel protein [Rickettsiella endosymbiont of Dermanyssus gallinae]
MLKKISTAALLIGICITQSARAEMDGFYAGAQLGYGNTHINTSNLVTINNGVSSVALPDLNNWAAAYRLSFGYQLNKNLAVEVGYRRFSNSEITATGGTNYLATASAQERAFDLTGKAILPLTKELSAYGKLGVAYVKANSQGYATTNGSYTSTSHSYTNTLEPTIGLGISYALKPNVPVEFSWNRIQKIGGGNHAPSSDFYALGVSYYFG